MTSMSRVHCLNICDEALTNKPHLAAVFDAKWRSDFRTELLKQGEFATIGLPIAYWLPAMGSLTPSMFPPETQMRVEHGLEVLWPQMSPSEQREVSRRLRSNALAACEELLAAAAFADQFGSTAVRWPSVPRNVQRPEFFVECPAPRWAVECKGLQDNEPVRDLNAEMLRTGQPCSVVLDLNHDPNRMHTAVVEKIKRAQGGSSAFIILTSYTPWLWPVAMQSVMYRILHDSAAIGLDPSELPVGVACLFWTVVQGIWFSDSGCAAASIGPEMRERIRRAIVEGFVRRGDGEVLTEASW